MPLKVGLLVAGSEVNESSIRNSLMGQAEWNMLALQVLEDTRVLSLSKSSSVCFHSAIRIRFPLISYLYSLHKCVVNILSLHFLTNQAGNTPKNSINSANLAVPGKESRDTGSIAAGRFGASVNVFKVILAEV